MLIDARNAIAGGKRSPLPPGVVRVEYLESTRTQYIDTEIIGGPGLRVQTRIATLEYVNDRWAIGAIDSGSRIYVAYQYRSGSNGGYWGGGYGYYFAGTDDTAMAAIGDFEDLDVQFTDTQQILSINGHERARWGRDRYVAMTKPLWLFGRSPTLSATFKCAIGPTKIWMDGKLVRDFIPVRVGELGYMYDRVSGRLFGNSGTGAFIIGPDV